MLSSRSSVITVAWISLQLLPLLIAALVWLVLGNWLVGLLLVILYPVYVVPYGFFISMPLMVRLFQPPASLYRR
jgi:hypothetical protein